MPHLAAPASHANIRKPEAAGLLQLPHTHPGPAIGAVSAQITLHGKDGQGVGLCVWGRIGGGPPFIADAI